MIPNLYNTEHYNEQQVRANDSRFLTDFYSFRLGPPRLRLLRVDDGIHAKTCLSSCVHFKNNSMCIFVINYAEPCIIEAHMRPLLSRCLVSYNKKLEDKTDYFPNWITIGNDTMPPDTNAAHLDAFRYQSQAELKGRLHRSSCPVS